MLFQRVAEGHGRRCPTLLTAKEMQPRPTVSCLCTAVRWLKQVVDDTKCRQGHGAPGATSHVAGKAKLAQPLWKSVWQGFLNSSVEM